ncbi:MAG: SDR family oxidoreductase [Candidatus Kapabacteria bacterium]|nr:SDR family oxidoreductase [Ignavibacteriota bacterium]MCW5884750.1 SDR family oxidoreductase [Candidatus Kapabacteria bacterium]
MSAYKIFSLESKVAIVTGASGLLGRNYSKVLSDAGAKVVLLDLNKDDCQDIAFELPNESLAIECDITSKSNLIAAKDEIINRFGKIDILVNNAAINDMVENPINALEDSKFENYPLELFRKVMDVNVTGTFLCCQIFGSIMAKNGSGSIINIASTYGITAPNQNLYIDSEGRQKFYKSCAYPSSKGAVIMLTKFLASYWGTSGIRVNCLSPGGVENNQSEDFIKKYSSMTPAGRMSKPDDYSGALIYLASDSSKYVNGHNLVADGGWTTW